MSASIPDLTQWPLARVMEQTQLFLQQGQSQHAIDWYRAWLSRHTDLVQCGIAWFNLGTLYAAGQQGTLAETAYREALRCCPGLLQARLNLGHQLEQQSRVDEALVEWQQVLQQLDSATLPDPELQVHALNNLARTFEVLRRYDESEAYMVRSLAVNPEQSPVLQHYVHIRQKQCKWPVYQALDNVTVNRQLLSTSALAMLAAHDDPALQLLVAREFVHNKVTPSVPLKPRRKRQPGERIKVGYLSGDLCMHAVGLLTVELFELHDRSKFEVYGFCWSRDDGSPLRARIVQAFEHHIPIGHLTDEQAAQVIVTCDIDILVDLQGLTSGARPNILMQRPAGAIQISYLGLPGTSALSTVDYIIADDFVFPPELEPYMTEKPLRLPHCYQVSDRKREVGPPLTRTACGLPENKFVFAVFNNNYKITQEMFACWMRILQQVPDSVLWLMADNPWVEQNLRQQAAAQGVDPSRLILTGRAQPGEYMARLALPDLFLDTFPYNAGTTANDILWMGTPILTYSGRSYISRMCGSLLTAVGLPDLIAFSLDDYERLAVRQGKNPKRIASYKRYLADHRRQSDLFDIPKLVVGLEHALASLLGEVLDVPASQRIEPVTAGHQSVAVDEHRPFRLQIEGWRGINHSFALVNQFQLREMAHIPRLELRHCDAPFRFAHWNRTTNGAGFYPDDEATINAISNQPFEGGADAIYRISSPLDLRLPKDGSQLIVFGVTELGLDEASLVPGTDIRSFEMDGGVIVTPSQWSRDRIIDFGFRPESVYVVPHAASPKYFFPIPPERRLRQREALGIGVHEVLLLNIGAAIWNKGIDVLLKAFALARQKRKDLRLMFKDQRNTYGISGEHYVQTTLVEAGLWSPDLVQAITLLPTNLSMDRMVDIYGVADCYVSPYRAEGFNLPVCEAMACGTPVIVTDGGATDDFVTGQLHKKIDSTLYEYVKIQDKLINAYREPDLNHLVELLLQVESKGTSNASLGCKENSGWGDPVKCLLDLCMNQPRQY